MSQKNHPQYCHKICSRMDWLDQHNLFSTDVIEGNYRMHLSPFTSIFAPISPLPWLQISYLKICNKITTHNYTRLPQSKIQRNLFIRLCPDVISSGCVLLCYPWYRDRSGSFDCARKGVLCTQ